MNQLQLRLAFALLLAMAGLTATPASAASFRDSPQAFTQERRNVAPLEYGMSPQDVSTALNAELTYISGKRDNEIFLAILSHGSGLLYKRADRIFLQFRKGRLTGWKGDFGDNWMWR